MLTHFNFSKSMRIAPIVNILIHAVVMPPQYMFYNVSLPWLSHTSTELCTTCQTMWIWLASS